MQSNFSIVNMHTVWDINDTMRQFREQEEVPKLQQLDLSEQLTAAFCKSTVSRDGMVRFIVRLPFGDSKLKLGESLTAATARLRLMHRRFQPHMENDRESEISVEVSENFYLPHPAVVKAENNERMLPRPNLNQMIFFVLLRFTNHQMAVICNEEGNRQTWRYSADCNDHWLMWKEELNHLAVETIEEATEHFGVEYLDTVRAIVDSYMVEYSFGVEAEREPMQSTNQQRKHAKYRYNFELQGFAEKFVQATEANLDGSSVGLLAHQFGWKFYVGPTWLIVHKV